MPLDLGAKGRYEQTCTADVVNCVYYIIVVLLAVMHPLMQVVSGCWGMDHYMAVY